LLVEIKVDNSCYGGNEFCLDVSEALDEYWFIRYNARS